MPIPFAPYPLPPTPTPPANEIQKANRSRKSKVCDKPAPARSPYLLNIRHLSSHRQRWLPIPKYNPKIDGPKVRSVRQVSTTAYSGVNLSLHIQVAFFDDDQKIPTTARKEDLL